MRKKLSAVVVAYNRAPLIGTCVRGLAFADEIIVVDKSSTDGTPAIAARHADRVITIPWSPTVEETRAFAVAQCTHDWILCLDDDECLGAEAIRFIQEELTAPRADVYGLLQRHYILGTHDEAAYYWPEHQIRMFRRGTVTFSATVHDGIEVHTDSVLLVPLDSGVAIHHLSHRDVAQWIEKANRYTSRLDRDRVTDHGRSLTRFAHDRIDHWLSRTRHASPGSYPEAVAVLRTTYDLIDRLKTWEEERGIDSTVEFQRICASLDAGYTTLGLVRDRNGEVVAAVPYSPRAVDEHDVWRRRLAHFRARHDALTVERDAHAAEAARLATDLASLARTQGEKQHAFDAVRQRAERAESDYARALTECIGQRQRAERAEAEAVRLDAESIGQRQRAERAEAESVRLGAGSIAQQQRADQTAARLETLQSEHAQVQGSLRIFMRGYLPRLRRHLRGQRP